MFVNFNYILKYIKLIRRDPACVKPASLRNREM